MRTAVVILFQLVSLPLFAQPGSYDSIVSLELPVTQKRLLLDSLLDLPIRDSAVRATQLHESAKFCYRHELADQSLAYAARAVALRRALRDTANLQKSLFNLGFFQQKAGKNLSSLRTFDQLQRLRKGDRYYARAHTQLGDIHTQTGDFHKAMQHYLHASAVYQQIGDHRGLCKNYVDISRLYALIDRRTWADTIFHLLSVIDSLGEIADLDVRDRIIIHQRRANLYDELEEYDLAIESSRRAVRLCKTLEDPDLTCLILNNLAVSERKKGVLEESRRHLDEAFQQTKDPGLRAMVYNNRGDLLLDRGDPDSALQAYQRSIQLYTQGRVTQPFQLPDSAAIRHSPYKTELLKALVSLSDYWWIRWASRSKEEDLARNLACLELADYLLDVLMFDSNEIHSRLYWRTQASGIYSKALRACHAGGDADRAFYFMERNKAILLLANLSRIQAQRNALIPDDLVEKGHHLYQQVVTLRRAAYDARKEGGAVDEDDLYAALFRYQAFQDSLKQAFPSYEKYLRHTPAAPLEAHRQQVINENSATLHYLTGEKDGYVLMVSKDTLQLLWFDAAMLQEKVEQFSAMISRPFRSDGDLRKYASCSHQLYRSLLAPLEQVHFSGNRLIISTDGLLQSLNFEMLNASADPAILKETYLINRYQVSYVYSFAHFQASSVIHRSHNGQTALFTPGRFYADELSPLPMSVEEGKRISELTGGDHFVGDQSTKSRFVRLFQEYRVVHLATHAEFSQEPASLYFHDAPMSIDELYGLNCNAELVVLSACGTSRGAFVRGEGVMSLARAFLYAGAKSVISTLDNVNDGASETIMTSFYERLSHDEPVSGALRQAKLDYLGTAEGSAISPYYWGHFIYIGMDGPDQRSHNFLWLMSVPVLVLIAGLFFRKRRIQR